MFSKTKSTFFFFTNSCFIAIANSKIIFFSYCCLLERLPCLSLYVYGVVLFIKKDAQVVIILFIQ